jgi:molecular chaperone GrpE
MPQPKATPTSARADAPEEVHELESRIDELEDLWRRALADLDNLRKRFTREVERERTNERGRVAASWLPIVDSLELALGHAAADPAAVIEGVRSVRDQAVNLLSALGFARDDEVGQPFDPARHEAVTAVPGGAGVPPGTVLHVVRPGYGEGEHQLRPAAVVVAANGE